MKPQGKGLEKISNSKKVQKKKEWTFFPVVGEGGRRRSKDIGGGEKDEDKALEGEKERRE